MKERTIYLAGGCFWGLEHLMHSLDGVLEATSGYANGISEELATYKRVCQGDTHFRECVKVTYDQEIISLEKILFAYFYVVHPEQKNRQGNDIGEQDQAGVYYVDQESKQVVEEIFSLEQARYQKFYVEQGPLKNFFPAEEYHQRYLDKNPNGYCHISFKKMNDLKKLLLDPSLYKRPSQEELKEKLSEQEYLVTQENHTDYPFTNRYNDTFEKGIYVDITTGEPLFSSLDKYPSSCGWPSFTKPIEEPSVVKLLDETHHMIRTEVKSRCGNAHLGHVFEGDHESPNGIRYCINSSSLKFIPYEQMDEMGYGFLKVLFDSKENS